MVVGDGTSGSLKFVQSWRLTTYLVTGMTEGQGLLPHYYYVESQDIKEVVTRPHQPPSLRDLPIRFENTGPSICSTWELGTSSSKVCLSETYLPVIGKVHVPL